MQKTTASTSLRLLILGGVASGALTALPGAARAQDLAPPTAAANASAPTAPAGTVFGAGGEWAVSVASYNGGPSFHLSKQASGGSSVLIQPALDYFIANGVSVGGLVGFSYDGSVTGIGLGARAGFNQALTERVSFWPTAGIIGNYLTGNGTSSSTATLVVLAPFLFHPAQHFFLGAGPFLSYLVKGGPDTQYGLDFVIGGWL